MRTKPNSDGFPKWTVVAVALIALIWLATSFLPTRDSDGRLEVYGTVELDGQELDDGQIWFTPATATTGPTAGGRIKDGEYHIASEVGPGSGSYDVRILTGEPGPPGLSRNTSGPPPTRTQFYFTRTLSESTGKQDFVLTDDAKRRPSSLSR